MSLYSFSLAVCCCHSVKARARSSSRVLAASHWDRGLRSLSQHRAEVEVGTLLFKIGNLFISLALFKMSRFEGDSMRLCLVVFRFDMPVIPVARRHPGPVVHHRLHVQAPLPAEHLSVEPRAAPSRTAYPQLQGRLPHFVETCRCVRLSLRYPRSCWSDGHPKGQQCLPSFRLW